MRLVLILGIALLAVVIPTASAGGMEGDSCLATWQGVSAPSIDVDYCIQMVMHDIDRVINGGP